jgi:tetratricopeptide (TPR) repeat protein
MDRHLSRAQVLIDQGRYALAEPELRGALAHNPDNSLAHSLLALCLGRQKQVAEATLEAHTAIGLAPDWPFSHCALAEVMLDRNRPEEAETAIREAIRLDPYNPQQFGLLSAIHLNRKRWQEALDAAEAGLALDAEHVSCSNCRAIALTQLGRRAEAATAIDETLARSPENPFSHANHGWNYLHQGNAPRALEHFREALRLDPNLEYARAGMVEALKARYIIYGLMLKYFLWMGRLSGRAQWGLVIGAYVGFRILDSVAAQNPALAPWIWPFLIVYLVFAALTWLASPLFNLMLRLSRFGRHALSPVETWAANTVGVLLLLVILSLALWLITDEGFAVVVAAYFGLLLLPVTATFNCQAGWPRRCMIVYTATLVSLGPAFVLLVAFQTGFAWIALHGFLLAACVQELWPTY